jgi:hypothetical protein
MAGFISLATTRPLAFLCKRGRRGYGGNAPSFSSFSDATSELAPPARLPEWVMNVGSSASVTSAMASTPDVSLHRGEQTFRANCRCQRDN